MAKLEDLSVGSVVNGLLSGEPITVVSTKWYGSSSMEVFYKTNQGTTGSQILYRDDEATLSVLEKSLPWSFDVEGEKLRLVSEAYRIHLAHLFDPYLHDNPTTLHVSLAKLHDCSFLTCNVVEETCNVVHRASQQLHKIRTLRRW